MTKILIVKLASLGDVLRTTSLLQSLHKLYKNPKIIWLTSPEAAPLLENNKLISEIWTNESMGILRLKNTTFDLVLSPDCEQDSSIIASMPKGLDKRGFFWDSIAKKIIPTNKNALVHFDLSHDDREKQRNKKTYQQLIHETCKLYSDQVGEIGYFPSSKELDKIRKIILNLSPSNDNFRIAFVTGAGSRWKQKAWPITYYTNLANMILTRYSNVEIVLLGGEQERVKNHTIAQIVKKELAHDAKRIYQVDTSSSVRLFGAVFHFANLVITGDTLGLHLALAARTPVIALVGPTSSTELELYDLGTIITTPLDCNCCYNTSCFKKPSCMDAILPEMVMKEMEQFLVSSKHSSLQSTDLQYK